MYLSVILLVSLPIIKANASVLPKLENKIVGGVEANIEDYPYQVSVKYYGQHICGGSIISNTRILTAAHCVKGFNKAGFTIRVGSSFQNSGGQLIKISDTMVDGLYNPDTYNYDLAVLFLETELIFSNTIRSIPTARHEPLPNTPAVVTGWGALAENQSGTERLQVVTVPIMGRKRCNTYYVGQITGLMICAGYKNGQKDSCQGDSGGPLVSNGVLVGIVSWGFGCARPHFPGVYSNVAKLVH